MSAALKKGVESGTLIKVKASYKLSPEAKKPAPKKKKVVKKKAAPKKKKTAPKKKVSAYITYGGLGTSISSSLLSLTSL